MLFYRVARALVAIFNKLVFFVRVKGERKLPEGPVILCPNHISFADPGAVAAAVDRRVTALAKDSLFRKPVLGLILRWLGIIPVTRGKGDFAAVRTAVEALKEDKVLMIFPQGTRCIGEYPNDSKVRGGAAMIAARTGASIVPVFIKTKDFRVRPFRRLELTFGKAFKVESLYDGTNDKNFVELARLIFKRITDLDSPGDGK